MTTWRRREIKLRRFTTYRPLYQWPLLAAFGLFALEMLANTGSGGCHDGIRRPKSEAKEGAHELRQSPFRRAAAGSGWRCWRRWLLAAPCNAIRPGRGGSNWRRLAAPHFVEELTRSHSPARRAIKNALLVLAAAGVGLALARPQWGEQAEVSHLFGQDTLFVLDCSRSMLATDVAPSRLQRAKLAILDYVQRHGHGRVGLVAFAGQAFLQCPLTFDYGAFQDALMAIDDKTIPVPGTDIGRALDEAFRAMDKSERPEGARAAHRRRRPRKGRRPQHGRSAGQEGRRGVHGGRRHAGGRGDPVPQRARQTGVGARQPGRGRAQPAGRSRLCAPSPRPRTAPTIPWVRWARAWPKSGSRWRTLNTGPGSAPARKLGVDRFHWPVAGVLVLLVAESLIGTRRRLRDIGG